MGMFSKLALKFMSEDEVQKLALDILQKRRGEGVLPWTTPEAISHYLNQFFDHFVDNPSLVTSIFTDDTITLGYFDGSSFFKFGITPEGFIIFAHDFGTKQDKEIYSMGFGSEPGMERLGDCIFKIAFTYTIENFKHRMTAIQNDLAG